GHCSNHLVLDVGAAESMLAYEMASLGYSVTAIDIRPIALSHPNLKFVKCDICKPVFPAESFDCVIALSTLEHIGLGWYGDKAGDDSAGGNSDCEAVKQISLLLKPEGRFILTVPYGQKAITPLHRVYDKEALEELLQPCKIEQAFYGVRLDDFTWITTKDETEAANKQHDQTSYLPGAVAMLVCSKKSA
ncbi:MAG: class I SAM-dependent methyltransferase, partial [Pyrinomonadaceae bacterium]